MGIWGEEMITRLILITLVTLSSVMFGSQFCLSQGNSAQDSATIADSAFVLLQQEDSRIRGIDLLESLSDSTAISVLNRVYRKLRITDTTEVPFNWYQLFHKRHPAKTSEGRQLLLRIAFESRFSNPALGLLGETPEEFKGAMVEALYRQFTTKGISILARQDLLLTVGRFGHHANSFVPVLLAFLRDATMGEGERYHAARSLYFIRGLPDYMAELNRCEGHQFEPMIRNLASRANQLFNSDTLTPVQMRDFISNLFSFVKSTDCVKSSTVLSSGVGVFITADRAREKLDLEDQQMLFVDSVLPFIDSVEMRCQSDTVVVRKMKMIRTMYVMDELRPKKK